MTRFFRAILMVFACILLLFSSLPASVVSAFDTHMYTYTFDPDLTSKANQKRYASTEISTKSTYNFDAMRSYLISEFEAFHETISISQYRIARSSETGNALVEYIRNDIPEMFHVNNQMSLWYSGNYYTELKVTYKYTQAEYAKASQELKTNTAYLLRGLSSSGLTDVEKALLIHDRLATWAEYGYEGYYHDMDAILLNHVGVCSAYARAYQYLVRQVGIESTYVSSDALDHAWNILKVDGNLYHVDVTWDDKVYDTIGRVYHENFLRSTNGMIATGHTASDYNTTPTSTKYDNAYWQNSLTEFQLIDNSLYFIDSINGKLYEKHGNSSTPLRSLSDSWGSRYISITVSSDTKLNFHMFYCLSEDNNILYYNTPSQVVQISLSGTTTPVYTPSLGSGYYIFGSRVKDGEIRIQYGTSPAQQGQQFMTYSLPRTYSVHFNGNGATSGSMSDQSFTYGVSQYLTANAFKRAFTVSYNYNGATSGNTASYATATSTFNGWATTAGGAKVYNDREYVSNLASSGIVNLYANWTAGTVTLPTPTKTGSDFAGWYTNSSLTNYAGAGGAKYTPTANITLYAKWNPKSVTLSSITVTQSPNKTQYYVGEMLDTTGLTVTAYYSNGSTKNVTNSLDNDPTTVLTSSGTKSFTVSYTEGGITRSASFSVTAKNMSPCSLTVPGSFSVQNGQGTAITAVMTVPADAEDIIALNIQSSDDSVVKFNKSKSSWNSNDMTCSLYFDGLKVGNATITVRMIIQDTDYVLKTAQSTATVKPVLYTLTYNDNGGSGGPGSQTGSGNITLSTKKPSRTGYGFLGWATTSTATTAQYAAGGSFNLTKNTTLYAVWDANTYYVKFNGNGATSGSMSNQMFKYDTAQYLTANAFKRAYTVTYTYNGATGGNSKTSDTANSTFNGWATTASGEKAYSDKAYVKNLATNGTFNLYANWTAGSVTLPTPTKTGNNFIGWYTNSALTSYAGAAGAKYTPTSSTTLYAKWDPIQYKLTYNDNGGSGGPGSQTGNGNITLSSKQPIRTGYAFLGWATSSSATSAQYTAGGSYNLLGNATLYAVWKANTYNVKFNGNGATSGSMSDQTFTYDAAQNLSANAFKRAYTVTYTYNGATGGNGKTSDTANSTFNGWATTAGGAKVYNDKASVKNLATNGTFNLYANWTAGSVTLPTPTRTHYIFDGWYTDSALTNRAGAAGAKFTPDKNTTLYAKWTPAPLTSIKITASPSKTEYYVGQRVDPKGLVVVATYSDGSTKDVTNELDDDPASTVLKAAGSQNIFVSYTYGGTTKKTYFTVTAKHMSPCTLSAPSAFEVVEGKSTTVTATITVPENAQEIVGVNVDVSDGSVLKYNPSKSELHDDMTFSMYFTGLKAGSTTVTVTLVNRDTGHALKTVQTAATVSLPQYTLTYNANGGSGAPAQQTGNGTVRLSDAEPSKNGYAFLGWATSSTAASAQYAAGGSFNLTKNTTLYAVWKANTYYVKFNGNGATSGSMSDQLFTYDAAQNLTANAFKREFTVTYKYNGATGGNSDASAAAASTFNGWATSADGAKVYSDKALVKNLAKSGSFNLYANWTAGYVTLPKPTKTHYIFDGWYTDSALTNPAVESGTRFTPDKNTTLYAKWNPVPLTSIAVTASPSKTEYYVGQRVDPTGLVVTATYSDQSTKVVTNSLNENLGVILTASGSKNVTVSYTEGGVTKKAYFTVTAKHMSPCSLTLPKTFGAETGRETDVTATVSVPAEAKAIVGVSVEIEEKDVLRFDAGKSGFVDDTTYSLHFTGLKKGVANVTVKLTVADTGHTLRTVQTTATVTDPVLLESIAVTKAPDKTQYYVGQRVDPKGLVVTATYSDQSTKVVTNSLDSSPYPILTSASNNKPIYVSYTENGITKKASFPVTAKYMSPCTLTAPASFVVKMAKEKSVEAAVSVPADAKDLVDLRVDVSDESILRFDSSDKEHMTYTLRFTRLSPGEATVTLSLVVKDTGHVLKTVPMTVPANPEDVKLTSIAVTTKPNKLIYGIGETFDPTGIVVTASYSDGSKKDVTDSVSYKYDAPFDSPGVKKITVTYKENNGDTESTASTSFTVTVVKKLSSIAVTKKPSKLTYHVGDPLDTTGMVVTATYTDGSKADVTAGAVSSPKKLTKEGTQTITVSYTEDGETKKDTFTVQVDVLVTVSIRNYVASRTIDYRETLTFGAVVEGDVSGAQVHWIINGKDMGTGNEYTVSKATSDYTVQLRYMKGSEVLAESQVETVNVSSGFFARLIAFFRSLFGLLPKNVQEVVGLRKFR